MVDWQPPADSAGHLLTKLNIGLIVITSVFVITRLCTRIFMLPSLGWDDLLATIAWIGVVAISSQGIIAVQQGLGTHIDQIPPEALDALYKTLLTFQLVFFVTVGFVRFSIVASYLKLSQERWFRFGLYLLAFLTFTITTIAFFFLLTECKYIPDQWDLTNPNRQCIPKSEEAKMFYANVFTIVAIDIGLLALPIWLVWSTMKFSGKRFQVILVFFVGIFAVIAGIVHMILIVTTDFAVDTSYKLIFVCPWSALQGHVGVWTACFPAFQPLFRLVKEKYWGTKTTVPVPHLNTISEVDLRDPSICTTQNGSNLSDSRESGKSVCKGREEC
ncbi:unnamed protein product [Clonostachys solani]|uniref:Rhodopsin domain-containing protein n=1 Tax=Clonostachys solani TaxID=160281 RepID=A0A9N9Z904_9HYPO|nr:unnamed protein product [Clonostachys solani]